MNVQVSHSRVETFVKCPHKFKLHYIDELETYASDDPANPLIIGTALHTGIEKDIKTAIEEYYASYPVITDKHIDEAIKLEAVIKKCQEKLPSLNDALFETEINCPEFKGFIDLLVPVDWDGDDEYFDMYDFKYSNNIRNYMNSGQLHEYKFYFEKLNPTKHIRNMYFLFAPKVSIRMKYKNKTNKKDETLEEFRKRLDKELADKEATLLQVTYDIEKVKNFLRNAKECREASNYLKHPSRLCDWCEYQKYCEEGEDLDIMNLPENKRRTVAANDKKKIWLYGAPFSGKTYLANEFPDPLMLNTDGNVKYVDAPYIAIKDEVSVEGRITKRTLAWQIFKDTIDELEKKQNDFKTIVVDLLEDTYEYCRLYMYDQLGISHESDDSFRAWDKVRIEFLGTIKRLMNLDYENIILISHVDTSKDLTRKGGDKISAIKPNIQDKAASKIAGMVDIVARVIDEDGDRILSFKTSEVIFGGGRLSLNVKEIPCDYDELCKVYEEANAGKKTSNVHESKKPARKKKEEVAATKEAEPTLEEDTYFKTADGNFIKKHAGDVAPENAEVITKDEFNEGVKAFAQGDVETTDAPPTEVETADAPPKRRTRRKAEEEPEQTPVEEPKEEAPRRRRRRQEA